MKSIGIEVSQSVDVTLSISEYDYSWADVLLGRAMVRDYLRTFGQTQFQLWKAQLWMSADADEVVNHEAVRQSLLLLVVTNERAYTLIETYALCALAKARTGRASIVCHQRGVVGAPSSVREKETFNVSSSIDGAWDSYYVDVGDLK